MADALLAIAMVASASASTYSSYSQASSAAKARKMQERAIAEAARTRAREPGAKIGTRMNANRPTILTSPLGAGGAPNTIAPIAGTETKGTLG